MSINISQKAFLFDLNGTIIDDMEYHAIAWEKIINHELNGGLSFEQVKEQMYGKNEELLIRIFGKDAFTLEEMDRLSKMKEALYQQSYSSQMKPIDGFIDFVDKATLMNIKMAIGSAAVMNNINFILDGLAIRKYFASIVSADDVEISKPNPETFLKGAKELNVPPEDCIVFEDAPKGVEAALNAGMNAVVLLTTHKKSEFEQYNNVLFYINDYNDWQLSKLLNY
jgi:beta-phosphoglucomutase family hydrolase